MWFRAPMLTLIPKRNLLSWYFYPSETPKTKTKQIDSKSGKKAPKTFATPQVQSARTKTLLSTICYVLVLFVDLCYFLCEFVFCFLFLWFLWFLVRTTWFAFGSILQWNVIFLFSSFPLMPVSLPTFHNRITLFFQVIRELVKCMKKYFFCKFHSNSLPYHIVRYVCYVWVLFFDFMYAL